MTYKRCQRSDRDGSFPEPPYAMGGGESVHSGTSKNGLRRSIRVLKCFSLWSNKQSRHGVRIGPSSNHVIPVLDVEDSWESSNDIGGGEEDFEVRTSSPAHSDDAVFDLSQALPAVPEDVEEEEEEEIESVQSHKVSENELNAASEESSKSSDYSSEFMTDDSTETSGLPWDSSFSQHENDGSMETPDAVSRIGIRPFEIPTDLGRGRPLNPEGGFIVESNQHEQQHIDHDKREGESYTMEQNTRNKELNEPRKPTETKKDISESPSDSSDTYSDDMRDVLRLLNDSKYLHESTRKGQIILPKEMETFPDEWERKNLYGNSSLSESKGAGCDDVSEVSHDMNDKPYSRVKELMKKFSGSSEREKDTQSYPILKNRTHLKTSASEDSSPFPEEKFDVPSEIIRHNIFHANETKGFFWRSRPTLAHALPDEELVDTSMSTTEGNRSMDYSDVFSQEELNREYSAPGEPTFIHI